MRQPFLIIARLSFGLFLVGWAQSTRAEGVSTGSPTDPEGIAFFEQHIRPVLVERCYKCHGGEAGKSKGGLRLDSRDGLRRGGTNGPVLVAGDPANSRLIQAIRYTDEDLKMPPKGPLSTQQVADFESWVKQGAPDPREEPVGGSRNSLVSDDDPSRRFWSFRPVVDPPVPAVHDVRWPLGPVDQFLLSKLESKGLTPAPPADKRALIRRATFDLTGLPPTPEEVEVFLADESTNAFEVLVDRLLASPHYGERWGRHWLDLVRYADTSGCNADFPVPSSFKYRNHVIDSFNRDQPYDQFVREQVAGDLLPGKNPEETRDRAIATGYLAISRRFGSGGNEFHLTIEDTIDNVGKAFLGLSVSCARCHDHKFDPIPQADYYAFYGIFKSTKYAFPGTELTRHTKDFVPLGPADEAEALRKYESEVSLLDSQIAQLMKERKPLQDAAKAGAPAPSGRTLIEVKADLEDARTKLRRLEENPPVVEKAYAVSEGTARDAKIQRKGDPEHQGDAVPRGFLTVLGGQKLPPDSSGSGRRELAQWLTDPKNPLFARVMVNRVWQHHFGRGIVATPNDFGTRGKPPSHPELLDYLATRFVQDGWSIKSLHKRIMLTHAYQTASADDPSKAAIDPENDLLWKFRRRRLSAEEVRDAMLAVSDTLDPTMAGAQPFPPESEYRYTQHKPFVAVYDTPRRSVYLMQQRIKKHPLLEVFDGADPNVTTPERSTTTTAIQALFLMNDPFAHDQADKLAVRVGMAFPEEEKRIDFAYRLAFGRPASAEEIQIGRDYLRACLDSLQETRMSADRRPRAALASYTRVLLSSNEFSFVD